MRIVKVSFKGKPVDGRVYFMVCIKRGLLSQTNYTGTIAERNNPYTTQEIHDALGIALKASDLKTYSEYGQMTGEPILEAIDTDLGQIQLTEFSKWDYEFYGNHQHWE